MGDTSAPTPISVHRCRFVDFQPAAITALSFAPLPLPAPSAKGKEKASAPRWRERYHFGTLVVGRANGDIELCEWTGDQQVETPQAWVVRKTFPGPRPSKVDSLALALRYPERAKPEDVPTTSELRLFTAGGGTDVIEWDMSSGSILRTMSSQGGTIWSMAVNPGSTMLALGCEDGAIRILSLELGSLQHHRRLDRVKTRILSLAWGPPIVKRNSVNGSDSDDEEEEDEWADEWLVAGGSDSSLRKWDLASGRVVDRMGTDKIKGERTLVWAVQTLGDGTIISGDSMGMVKFWDSRTCTQLQSFPAHGADVLCMAISPEGSTVYTSGVDQKIAQFSLVRTASTGSSFLHQPQKWVHTVSRRLHSHDVRALAIWPPYTLVPPSHRPVYPVGVAPVLVSGGLDMNMVLTPAASAPSTSVAKIINPLSTSVTATFEDAYHRRLAYSARTVCVARLARLVVSASESGVSIWRVHPQNSTSEEDPAYLDGFDPEGQRGGWEKILEMELAFTTNIVACGISQDGRWIVVSDHYETKLFALHSTDDGTLKPKRVRDFAAILVESLPSTSRAAPSTGGTAFVFTPDSLKLVMSTTSAYILIIDLSSERPRVVRRFEQHRMEHVGIGKAARTKQGGHEAAMDVDGEGSEDDEEEQIPSGDDAVGISVSRMCVSTDGQWLATTDDRCRTYIFNLDSIQHHSVVPTMPQPIHAMAFNPSASRTTTLIMALANNTIQIYDVDAREFPNWARELSASLPKRFTGIHDSVIGVTFDPASASTEGAVALFWGATWICKVQLDRPAGWGGFSRKRRRAQKGGANEAGMVIADISQQQQNFKVVTHYRPILALDFFGPREMVVVERPLVDVLARLPPAYFRPKYGRS
ncbi:WD40 repeat-like protein [Punctularia strigosozonata HHB-11173 SS5]|uniref:WD40 repeat-like protein n=1 Tax=Punctularia strigosozonata (strain HHB-11173) TaxID=741275 RepID=UPI0004417FD7|nr:WD40 repeat-like protein [Punctularia strigosozonata HHB-11173 SS5]EIN13583.1 WD40 repeat-like protein [Punctularia strigosozonata HHB-11173 SS5]